MAGLSVQVAMMSRPVAGVRNKTLIITLPGSPKGAKENLQSVLKLLPHACKQAMGGDSRAMHSGGVKKLEKDAGVAKFTTAAPTSPATSPRQGHSHDHDQFHHHAAHPHEHAIPKPHTDPSSRPPQSNDPNAGPIRRARSSPYPMLSVPDAVALVLEHTPSPKPITFPVTPALAGYVLAADVKAAEAVPAYRASIVDGYAVIVDPSNPSATKGTFPVASISHASSVPEHSSSVLPPLQPGHISRITTGAPLPPNANAVIMVEDTTIASLTPDNSEEATVTILTGALQVGENVREPGSDVALGSTILKAGTLISATGGELGMLVSAGISCVSVYAKPIIGVLSTGDELVSHPTPTSPEPSPSSPASKVLPLAPLHYAQVRDSNRPSLLNLLTSWGLQPIDLGIARDTPSSAIETALRKGLLSHCDAIITTGGVSMGELDLLKPTIERSLGGTIHFGRVNMKPGKPTTFATVPFKNTETGKRENKLIFSLPGNPASALVTANLFVLPSVQKSKGLAAHMEPNSSPGRLGLPKVKATLTHSIKLDPSRPEYHRAVVVVREDGRLYASSTGGQRSSRVGSLARANALLELPAQKGELGEGEVVGALMMGHVLSEL
jgi:gephyrin